MDKKTNVLELPNAVQIKENNNTRHFGGYETNDGKKVLAHRFIRSGIPSDFTDEDINYLKKEYNLNICIDLRFDDVESGAGSSLTGIEGIKYIQIPLIDDTLSDKIGDAISAVGDHSKTTNKIIYLYYLMGGNLETCKETLLLTYTTAFTEDYSIARMREIFDVLLENEKGCIINHCTGGKDRTGVVASVVLSALGVAWETIVDDYLLTNEYRKEVNEAEIAEVMEETDDPDIIEFARFITLADIFYLDHVLETVNERYGSMDGYIREGLKLTDDDLQKLKDMYTA